MSPYFLLLSQIQPSCSLKLLGLFEAARPGKMQESLQLTTTEGFRHLLSPTPQPDPARIICRSAHDFQDQLLATSLLAMQQYASRLKTKTVINCGLGTAGRTRTVSSCHHCKDMAPTSAHLALRLGQHKVKTISRFQHTGVNAV